MRIVVVGGDGYLGWPTSLYFSKADHTVLIIDNLAKRNWEKQCNVRPLVPIPPLQERINLWNSHSKRTIEFAFCDISEDYNALESILAYFKPDAIIHYGEQASAPYSMASRANAVETQRNNVLGTLNLICAIRATCPDTHLIKLGTMGEYGLMNPLIFARL
jgi:UDP-sulfoquinovose synthase